MKACIVVGLLTLTAFLAAAESHAQSRDPTPMPCQTAILFSEFKQYEKYQEALKESELNEKMGFNTSPSIELKIFLETANGFEPQSSFKEFARDHHDLAAQRSLDGNRVTVVNAEFFAAFDPQFKSVTKQILLPPNSQQVRLMESDSLQIDGEGNYWAAFRQKQGNDFGLRLIRNNARWTGRDDPMDLVDARLNEKHRGVSTTFGFHFAKAYERGDGFAYLGWTDVLLDGSFRPKFVKIKFTKTTPEISFLPDINELVADSVVLQMAFRPMNGRDALYLLWGKRIPGKGDARYQYRISYWQQDKWQDLTPTSPELGNYLAGTPNGALHLDSSGKLYVATVLRSEGRGGRHLRVLSQKQPGAAFRIEFENKDSLNKREPELWGNKLGVSLLWVQEIAQRGYSDIDISWSKLMKKGSKVPESPGRAEDIFVVTRKSDKNWTNVLNAKSATAGLDAGLGIMGSHLVVPCRE